MSSNLSTRTNNPHPQFLSGALGKMVKPSDFQSEDRRFESGMRYQILLKGECSK
jgi:hypothetical protein